MTEGRGEEKERISSTSGGDGPTSETAAAADENVVTITYSEAPPLQYISIHN